MNVGKDLAGNEIRNTNFNGMVITNQFDLMNHCTNRSSTGYFASFAFSPTGQRTNMTDQSGTATYQYNARDCLTNKVVAWSGGPVVSLSYGLDANGNVTNTWSSTTGGVNLQYSLDALNRITNVLANGAQAASYVLDLAGNVRAVRYGNGVTNLAQFDVLNRLTNSIWKLNASTLASFYYQLGATGNRTNLTETLITSVTNRTYAWGYDRLYRLTTEAISGLGGTTYGLDPVGNRTNRTAGLDGLPAQNFSYTTNDWLANDAYDSNGNTLWTTNGGTAAGPYYYNVEDRLTNFNNSVFLAYDGDGLRVRKTANGTNYFYLVDDRNPSGYAQVLEEWTGSGGTTNLSRVYNWGLALISQREASGPVYYFLADGHGSTRLLTDTNAAVVNAFTFDAYGNLIASNGPPQTPHLYCGEYFDSHLSFYYLRAPRYLNPDTGRFTTGDTFQGNQEDPLSLHKYIWGWDNPVNLTDPSGHAVYFVTRKLSIAYGGLAYKLANVGHGYLLFTLPIDQGTEGDPLTHGYPALTTFSWHPQSWDYANGPAGYDFTTKAPGRVWERHTDDTHPSSYHAYLITANASQQAALLNAIHSWIDSEPVGYERGQPKDDPSNPGKNTIGAQQHRPAAANGVYYSLMEQNCVWWATIMLMQNGVAIPQNARNAIIGYNGGHGAASQVLSGNRSANTVHRMTDILEGMSLQTGGYNVDMGGVGLGGF